VGSQIRADALRFFVLKMQFSAYFSTLSAVFDVLYISLRTFALRFEGGFDRKVLRFRQSSHFPLIESALHRPDGSGVVRTIDATVETAASRRFCPRKM
jgi:hypothetical protein